MSCFNSNDAKAVFFNECGAKSYASQPVNLTVRYVGKVQNGETRKEIEHIDKYFANVKPYKGEDKSTPVSYREDDTTLSRFLNVSTDSAYMYQKRNGAWYLAKSYRGVNEKMQRKVLYIGKGVCRKDDSVKKKRRQALKYCTKKSKAAFKARDWQGWMEWRSIRYALRKAVAADDPLRQEGSTGSEEGGGWSSIYTISKNEGYALLLRIHGHLYELPQPHTKDVYDAIELIEYNPYAYDNSVYEGNAPIDAMSKQSWLYSLEKNRKELDSAYRSARNGVFNYSGDDYDDQDKNSALLKPQALVTFSPDPEDEEYEVAQVHELGDTEELPREEPKDETEEEALKKKPKREKSESRKEFLKNATIYRPVYLPHCRETYYEKISVKKEDKDKRSRTYEIRLAPCSVCRSTTGECSATWFRGRNSN